MLGWRPRKKHDVLIAYGNAAGIYDVWEVARFARRHRIKEAVIVVEKEPTKAVAEEARRKGIKLIIDDKPSVCSSKLKNELESENRSVILKKLENIADRSIMQDPC